MIKVLGILRVKPLESGHPPCAGRRNTKVNFAVSVKGFTTGAEFVIGVRYGHLLVARCLWLNKLELGLDLSDKVVALEQMKDSSLPRGSGFEIHADR